MSAPALFIMQFYRRKPGDLFIPEIQTGAESLPAAQDVLTRMLSAYHGDDTKPEDERPEHARLLTSQRDVNLILTCLPAGRVEVVMQA